MARALLLGSVDTAEAARTHADLVITPQNDGVGMLEFHQLDRMRDAVGGPTKAACATSGSTAGR